MISSMVEHAPGGRVPGRGAEQRHDDWDPVRVREVLRRLSARDVIVVSPGDPLLERLETLMRQREER
jgi:hypothetical protein